MNRMQQTVENACQTAKSLSLRIDAAILASFILISMSPSVSGQLTITNPAKVDQVNAKSSIQFNGQASQDVINASHSHGIQVRVATIKLLVDEETRNAIYQNVGAPGFSVQTLIDPPPPPTDLTNLEMATFGNAIQSTVTVRSPTTCAMAIVDRSVSDQILSQISQANPASIKRSPAVMLVNGKVAEMNDVSERPYVIGYDASNASGTIETFEEGMKIRMLAIPGTDSMRFIAQIISSKITGVGQVKLPPGPSDADSSQATVNRTPVIQSPVIQSPVIQVPVQQTQSIVVSANLAAKQCLLVDPHVTESFTTTEESPTPMFGKIPYIGKNFSNSTSVQVDRHVFLLMVPSMVGK